MVRDLCLTSIALKTRKVDPFWRVPGHLSKIVAYVKYKDINLTEGNSKNRRRKRVKRENCEPARKKKEHNFNHMVINLVKQSFTRVTSFANNERNV